MQENQEERKMKKQCYICNKVTEDIFNIRKSSDWVCLCRECFKHRKNELYKDNILIPKNIGE